MNKKILLIDHYDSFTYNLLALMQLQGLEVTLIKNNEYTTAKNYDALVFSPGPSNPSDPSNAGSSLRYFDEYAGKLPIFGVCLGMQIIGHKLPNCKVRQAHSIQHGKTDQLKIKTNSTIFAGIPNNTTIVRYHSLALSAPQTYISSHAASDEEVMSLEIPEQKLYGVQFHPESLLSEHGAQMIRNFSATI